MKGNIVCFSIFSCILTTSADGLTGDPLFLTNLPINEYSLFLEKEVSIFVCKSGQVILGEHFCDGFTHCLDGTDEELYIGENDYNISTNFVRCNNIETKVDKSCGLPHSVFCDVNNIMCENVSQCDAHCPRYYRCSNDTKLCVKKDTLCDGIGCNGCVLEDHGWENGPGFKCLRNGKMCILPQQLLKDSVTDCDGGVDRCYSNPPQLEGLSIDLTVQHKYVNYTATFKDDLCFHCFDGEMIVPKADVCNGVFDCKDLSDECLCVKNPPSICNKIVKPKLEKTFNRSSSICNEGYFTCEEKCFPRSSVCNGKVDCYNQEDETNVYCNGTIPCHDAYSVDPGGLCRCATDECSGTMARMCDKIVECEDVSDECSPQCWSIQTTSSFDDYPNPTPISCPTSTRTPVTNSKVTPIFCQSSKRLNNFSVSATVGNVTIYTTMLSPVYRCDGYLLCDVNFEDETECTNNFVCNKTIKGIHSVPKSLVCNGIRDCGDGSDESRELCGNERFFCDAYGKEMVSISKKLVCDNKITCDKAEDEANCTDNRFYCENNKPPLFVPKNQIMDGIPQCSDWSDECPSDPKLKPDNIFSSRDELIGNAVLRVFVWIMGVTALIGNLTVLITEIKNLRKMKNRYGAMLANRCLILNLAVSDLLMGIYLVLLGVIGQVFKGRYCANQQTWRASNGCTTLGILSVISAETSVASLVSLTAFRLFAVRNPIKSLSKPSWKILALVIGSCWGISFILALVPLSSHLGYMFYKVIYNNSNPFAKNELMDMDKVKSMVLALKLYESNSTISDASINAINAMTWKNLQQVTKQELRHYHYFDSPIYIGYYSTHGVCIPKYFVERGDISSKFSFTVTVFNFIAFLFVLFSYILIYYTSSGKSLKNTATMINQDSTKLKAIQRRILRLILTDFCCWIPICIIAFIMMGGVSVSNRVYAFAAIILLPINSALNPILYSDVLDKLFNVIRLKIFHKKTTTETYSSSAPSSSDPIGNTRL